MLSALEKKKDISHWDYKNVGYWRQAPVHAEQQRRGEEKTKSEDHIFALFASRPKSDTLLCSESREWRMDANKMKVGENKNPKIYIFMFIFIYIYIFTRYVSTKNTQYFKVDSLSFVLACDALRKH